MAWQGSVGIASAVPESFFMGKAMPEIHIAYDLPDFDYAFLWTATEEEAANLLDSQLAAMAEHGNDPAALLAQIVVQAPALLRAGGDEDSVRDTHVMLTAWALQQNAGHPDFPGRVIDYLPTHDFEVLVSETEPGEISATITALSRDDFDVPA